MRTCRIPLALFALLAAGACARHGREVFLREGCVNCHCFRGVGNVCAVDLSDVGSRRDPAWIETQIGNPAAHNPATSMPPFPEIRWYDRRSLIAFLCSSR
jgi:cbb3-type cytochrome oxidase cytochrome c subunit